MTLSIGSWCGIGHPAAAEILAGAGFEWLALDCEHGEAGESDIGNFCRACGQYRCRAYVRVKNNDLMAIRRALDLGAAGVIVPLVSSAAEAERAVRAASYPPRGVRGFAWHRGNAWGRDFASYTANFRPTVIVMIESGNAVAGIDAIVRTEGVDGCLIGPYDLSGSFGIPGQVDSPAVTEACARAARAAAAAGKMAGIHIVSPTPERIGLAVKQGFSLLALGSDAWFLRNGAAAAVQALKQTVSKR